MAAILRQAINDTHCIWNGLRSRGGVMVASYRRRTRRDPLRCARLAADDAPAAVTLEQCCEYLGLNPVTIRTRVLAMARGKVNARTRRRCLRPHEKAAILKALAAGVSTAKLAERHRIDSSTCRKLRIKARRAAMA